MGWTSKFNETVTVEPAVFLFFLSISIVAVAWPQTLYTKYCRQQYENLTECSDSAWEERHPGLQGKTSTLAMYSQLTGFFPVLICVPMMSAYSDKYGLRAAMLFPFVGGALSGSVVTLQVVYLDWRPELILISPFITGCSGYLALVLMACMTYVTRDPFVKNTAMRIAVLEALCSFGYTVGGVIVGPILDWNHGLTIVWLINASAFLLAALDIIFRVRHLPPPTNTADQQEYQERRECSRIRACCNIYLLKDYIVTVMRPRLNHKRLHIHLATIGALTIYCATAGVTSIQFLFLTKEHGLSNTVYSIWMGALGASSILGNTVFSYIFTTLYPISDMTFCTLGGISSAIMFGMMAYAQIPAVFWSLVVFKAFSGLNMIGVRLYVSRAVDRNEQAAGMGYVATMQTISSLAGTLIFNYIYPLTLSFWPGVCFSIAGFVAVVTVPFFTVVKWNDMRHGDEWLPIKNDADENANERITSRSTISGSQ